MTPGDEIADAIDPFPTDSDGDQFPDSPPASICWPSLEDAGSGVLDVQVIIGRSNGQKEEVFLLDAYSYEPVRHSAELPTLLGVTPKHTTAHQALSLVGSSFGSSIKSYRVVYVGSGPPPNGANIQTEANSTRDSASHAICRPQALNMAAFAGMDHAQPSAPVMPEDAEPLPIWEDFFRCQVGDFAAGSYNVSVQLDRGRAWTNPEVAAGLFEKNARGLSHQVQYFPTITYLSISEGSTAGGAFVEILGTGFDEHLERNQVLIEGKACTVTLATPERITCTAPAQDAAEAPLAGNSTAGEVIAPVIVDDAESDEHPGMQQLADAAAFGGSFSSDNGISKGTAWLRYKPVITHSNLYEVFLEVPRLDPTDTNACAPRASNVSVVIQHSGSSRLSSITTVVVETMDLGPQAANISLGEYLFIASQLPGTASVTIDNSGSSGCVVADRVSLHPRGMPDGELLCEDPLALNYGSIENNRTCLYLGGRGIVQQSWGIIAPTLRDQHTGQNPLSWAMRSTAVESECPWPGSEDGWSTRDGVLLGDSVDADCSSGNCPSHQVCPDNSFCCLDIGHEGCRPALQMPAGGSYATGCTDLKGWVDIEGLTCAAYLKTGTCIDGTFSSGIQRTQVCDSAKDGIDASRACCACGGGIDHTSSEGWKLVFRQRLPKTNTSDISYCNYEADRGFFNASELRKYPSYPKGSLYSILDEIEESRADDGFFEFRMVYPGTAVDIQWKQNLNPTWANSATMESAIVLDESYTNVFCQPGDLPSPP